MDVLFVLYQHHERLLSLLVQLEKTPWENTAQIQTLFHQLAAAFLSQSRGERELLYSRLMTFREARRLVRESLQELLRLEHCVEEIKQLKTSDDRWYWLYEEFKDGLREHIHEQEDGIFKKIRKLFREPERGEMGLALSQYQASCLTSLAQPAEKQADAAPQFKLPPAA